ncbi:hypothetical protein TcasGA2_TC031488 [Tribolium castaneum]|uniref:Uncharacterized protein n=1 Tax=Tribolium castaneum TaxID=7070 RepID=A0A139WNM2_TRICA|nr:hypothetical protein TcasGA2_TC031488 [Tribolium castaneum]
MINTVYTHLPRRILFGLLPAVALAPTPVLVGYSLVGVYPCAVWKPRHAANSCTTSSTGPVRSRVTAPARSQPYPTQQVQVHHCQGHQEATTTTTAAARVQPPQLLVTACSCNNNNNTAELQVATNNTPMVFVPFSMPSYAPPMAASALYTNSCSPSKDMKGGWAASPGSTAPVNPPTLLALQPLLTQPSTPVQTVQPSTTTAATQPKQDTSSK